MQVSMKLGEAMYRDQGAAAGPASGAAAEPPPSEPALSTRNSAKLRTIKKK